MCIFFIHMNAICMFAYAFEAQAKLFSHEAGINFVASSLLLAANDAAFENA